MKLAGEQYNAEMFVVEAICGSDIIALLSS